MTIEIYDRGFIARALVFTLTYLVIGILVPLQQGEPTVAYSLGASITGFLYALVLGTILTQMPLRRRWRLLSVWIAIYVVQLFNPLIEGLFFTNQFEDPSLFIFGALFGAILALVYSMIAGFLFTPKSGANSFMTELRNYFGQRKATDWAWRVVTTALSWPLIYFIFGSIVAPIVTPYYTDPTAGYGLVLPSLETVISVQVLRGFIYVGSLLPITVSLKIRMKHLLLSMIGLLYIGGGLAIFVIVETFPLTLRIVHGLEMLADSILFGSVIAFLLGWRLERAVAREI